jgi:hypothetical protein
MLTSEIFKRPSGGTGRFGKSHGDMPGAFYWAGFHGVSGLTPEYLSLSDQPREHDGKGQAQQSTRATAHRPYGKAHATPLPPPEVQA